jgi:hypothetical protein
MAENFPLRVEAADRIVVMMNGMYRGEEQRGLADAGQAVQLALIFYTSFISTFTLVPPGISTVTSPGSYKT